MAIKLSFQGGGTVHEYACHSLLLADAHMKHSLLIIEPDAVANPRCQVYELVRYFDTPAEQQAHVCQLLDVRETLGTVGNRHNKKAAYVAYVNIDDSSMRDARGAPVGSTNALAYRLLAPLGFVTPMRHPHFRGRVIVAGANARPLTREQIDCVMNRFREALPQRSEDSSSLSLSSQ